jgi:hypothetical protein
MTGFEDGYPYTTDDQASKPEGDMRGELEKILRDYGVDWYEETQEMFINDLTSWHNQAASERERAVYDEMHDILIRQGRDIEDAWNEASNHAWERLEALSPDKETSDECPLSKRVDGKNHSWKFDGDDPYIICMYCGEERDSLTGTVIKKGRS